MNTDKMASLIHDLHEQIKRAEAAEKEVAMLREALHDLADPQNIGHYRDCVGCGCASNLAYEFLKESTERLTSIL